MATKLGRSTYPANHDSHDFECFGPIATQDTIFSGCKMADLGCFKQDEGVDSNKYYHAAVVKSNKNNNYYLYIEYGRTVNGTPHSPQFMFTECSSLQEAMKEFEKQCAEKNTKRGVWEQVGSKNRLVPKTKKNGTTEDLYVVRSLVSRSVGLPSAKSICNESDVIKNESEVKPKKSKKKLSVKIDASARKLLTDLYGGTVSYTRSVMTGNTLPSKTSIDEARSLLDDATNRLSKVGDDIKDQVSDSELKKLTYALYGIIPKAKDQHVSETAWILSQDNIGVWNKDLDAFESALVGAKFESEDDNDEKFNDIRATIKAVDLNSDLGKYLSKWWKGSTRNKHGHRGLTIHNMWSVERDEDYSRFNKVVDEVNKTMPSSWNNERPMFYDEYQSERCDLDKDTKDLYHKTNTSLLFHGTRSVNVAGIMREHLRLPGQLVGVTITGAMFGPGIYSADDWGKSANYCSSPRSLYSGNSGHINGRKSFMFAVDVCLGNPHVAKHSYNYTSPPNNCHSVYGKAGHSGVVNNEWIIYNNKQIVLKYLAEVSWY